MLNSKQRAKLRGMANSYETILQIGHQGLNEQTFRHVDEALTKRELIKLRVLESCPISAREAADEIAKKVNADVVQVIGYRFILYRKNQENPIIEI